MRLGPGAKLLVLLSFNVLALTFDKFENLLCLTVLALVCYLLSRPDLSRIRLTLLLLAPAVWGVTLSQALFYQEWPRTVLLVIVSPDLPVLGWLTGGVYLYYQGFAYGLRQSLRLIAVFLVGLSVAWTTSESSLLRTLRETVRNAKLSVAISVAARFLRVILDEAKSVYTVFSISGFKLSRLRDAVRLVVPLIAQVIRRSYTVSLTLLSRGFNPNRVPAARRVKPRLTVGGALALSFLVFSATLGLIKLLTALFLLDVLYIPALKPVYYWAMNSL